ncbi:MAG: hypothetical protein AAGF11_20345 [Myxococcota bacterium]
MLASTLLAAAVADAVRWQAPAGCPEAVDVRERVSALLGRVPTQRDLQAEGIIDPGPPWRLELSTTIGGRLQRRVLEANDCATVTEAAALILAVSVDPLRVSPQVAPAQAPAQADVVVPAVVSPQAGGIGEVPGGIEAVVGTAVDGGRGSVPVEGGAPQPEQGPEQEPEQGQTVPRTSRERARARPRAWLRLGVGGELGAVPRGTGGVRLGVVLEGARAHLRLDGGYWIDRVAVLREDPEQTGAQIGLGTVTLAGGPRLGGERVAVPIAVGIEAGGLRTRGVGLVSPRVLTFAWVAGVVSVGVRAKVAQRLAVWGVVEGFIPVRRPSVRVGQGATEVEVHRVAPLGGRILLGLAVPVGRK